MIRYLILTRQTKGQDSQKLHDSLPLSGHRDDPSVGIAHDISYNVNPNFADVLFCVLHEASTEGSMHMQKPGELLVWFPMCNVSTMSSCKAAEATGNLISITPGGDLDRVVPSFF